MDGLRGGKSLLVCIEVYSGLQGTPVLMDQPLTTTVGFSHSKSCSVCAPWKSVRHVGPPSVIPERYLYLPILTRTDWRESQGLSRGPLYLHGYRCPQESCSSTTDSPLLCPTPSPVPTRRPCPEPAKTLLSPRHT